LKHNENLRNPVLKSVKTRERGVVFQSSKENLPHPYIRTMEALTCFL